MISRLKNIFKKDKNESNYIYNSDLFYIKNNFETTYNTSYTMDRKKKDKIDNILSYKSKYYYNPPECNEKLGDLKNYLESTIDYHNIGLFENTINIKSKNIFNTSQTFSQNKKFINCKGKCNFDKNCCSLCIRKKVFKYDYEFDNDSFNEFNYVCQESNTESSTSFLESYQCKHKKIKSFNNRNKRKDNIYVNDMYEEDKIVSLIKHYEIIIEHLKKQMDKNKKNYKRKVAENKDELSIYLQLIEKYQQQLWREKNKLLIENKKVENLKKLLLDAYKNISQLKNKLQYVEDDFKNTFPELELKKLCIL
ncbi:Hypothetical protein SRAE_1000213800 [Strongyloides ratti]|uniref:Uncharacterized protein n=1 Tax=Strongyloides ratti TaxID=34506 RepID=A0A090L2G1_STRRB|nr:Hypothetical protein SRAE_1000213800 [Strongyloides ratti]CEF63882.1 Hypothetical protein SRAE_1000213800 [Strongyloides ratti]